MTDITKSITYLNEYKRLKEAVLNGQTPALAVGLSPVHKAHLASALGLELGRTVCVLTDDDASANRISSDIRAFSEKEVVQLPARDVVLADMAGVSRGYEQRRIAAMDAMPEAKFVTASVQAAFQRTLPPSAFKESVITLKTGATISLEELSKRLARAGYERCAQVEGVGQFSIRGGILDVSPPNAHTPFRIEFWDDEIDSITAFDAGSQRRLDKVDTLRCLPCMEALPHLAKGGTEGLVKAVLGLLSTRRKKHPELRANLERDAERLRETGTLPAADK